MNKFCITAKNLEKQDEARQIAARLGFVYDEADPGFVISLGGDGTYLICEYQRPGIPKLLVRDSLICAKCHDEPLPEMLELILKDKYRVVDMMKLEAISGNIRKLAVNDIVMRNADQRHALRFSLDIGGVEMTGTVIGDGIVAATPFGSTGYYHSVTGSTFASGFAIGFNNPTNTRKPICLEAGSQLTITIQRSDAYIAADNQPDMQMLHAGDKLTIRAAAETARRVGHK